VAAAVAHQQDIFVRNSLLERFPQRLSPLLGHAVALNRYAAEVGKPDGQRLEEYSDANFPALKQQIVRRRRSMQSSKKPCSPGG
jgi:hypothetical protein